MVALVLVSHSRALALALGGTLAQLYGDRTPPIAVAAGAGDNGEELGTDATAILAALEEVSARADETLVLLDLGSAVLSAELALDLLDESLRGRVALCSAPLVEGAIAAAALCGVGASLAEVRAEADNALRQKIEHLGGGVATQTAHPPAPESRPSEPPGVPTAVAELRVNNPHGLHARPAMRIVQAVAAFKSKVQIQNLRTGAPPASARSLVSINCLDARQGDMIRVTASGIDAAGAVRALESLHAEQFGDSADEPTRQAEAAVEKTGAESAASEDRFPQGSPLSEGIAVGRLFFAEETTPLLPPPPASIQSPAEIAKLHGALASVRTQLEASTGSAAARFGQENAAILQAHLMLADDPALIDRAVALIEQDGLPAAHAWQQASREVADAYHSLGEPLLRERARDVEDLALRVLRELGAGSTAPHPLPDEPCILAVPVLLPGEVSALDFTRIKGIIAEAIGRTSHAAILLRAAGIPAVEGVDLGRLHAMTGTRIVSAAFDGGTGEVWLEPDEITRHELEGRRASAEAGGSDLAGVDVSVPLCTRDGRRVELAANVTTAADAAAAARAGAEAIGLLRTEFLFFDRHQPPTEDEQTEAIRQIAAAMPPGSPITVRTFDIGGDKPVPFLPVPPETNPFLGVRGLRLALRQPALFKTHLRAILRAAHGHRFRLMFPMVTEVSEVRQARALLVEAHDGLVKAGQDHAWPLELGMMVEVPAAALDAPRFVREIDFFSIGTNDLTQYTLAAERGHPRLAPFADAMHPAVLRLVARVAAVAERAGKWAGICGEAAADPIAAATFIGLGIRELSVGAGSLGRVRRLVSECDYRWNRGVARRCLQAGSGPEARRRWEPFGEAKTVK